jgi:hypothetical protein
MAIYSRKQSHSIRDLAVLVVLFALLIGFAAFTFSRQAEVGRSDRGPAFSTHSSAPTGVKALALWLDALGYRTSNLEYSAFNVPAAANLLVVVGPQVHFEPADALLLATWVSNGGTLVVAVDDGFNGLLTTLGATIAPLPGPAAPSLRQPFFNRPPLVDPLPPVYAGISSPPRNAVVHLAVETSPGVTVPTLVSVRFGRGKFYLTTHVDAFTNAGLRNPANAALVYNLLRDVPAGGQILFDEYHHGFSQPPEPGRLLFRSPWGWALLYAAGIVLAFMALNGRAFGAPLPLADARPRRSTAEYVTSLANLLRRARQRGPIAQHYHDELKRRLARPYRINPAQGDLAFTRELARYREIDPDALFELLKSLNRDPSGERELVRLVAEADRWLK